jgi:hypothetical protein
VVGTDDGELSKLIFSIILMGITAGRISYTEHLDDGNPVNVNGGSDYYDPDVVELLVCSLLQIGFSIFLYVFSF